MSRIYAAATAVTALDPIEQNAVDPLPDDFVPQIELKSQAGFGLAYVEITPDGSTTEELSVQAIQRRELVSGYESNPSRSEVVRRFSGWEPAIVLQSSGVAGADIVIPAGSEDTIRMLVDLSADVIGVALFNAEEDAQEGISYRVVGVPESIQADALRTLLEQCSPLPVQFEALALVSLSESVGALEPSLVGSEGDGPAELAANIATFAGRFADESTGLRAVIIAREDNGGSSGWPAYPNGVSGASDPATDTVDKLIAYVATLTIPGE